MASPFTPLGPKAQRRQVTALVNAQILPLIAQINAEIDRRSRSGSAAISSSTDALARLLGPLASQTHATYTGAEARQGADDAALADRLTRVGGDVASGLGAQLKLAGLNPDAAAGAAQQQGAGAGATVAGLGSAALGNLRSTGAAAEAYSGQLPGIARMGGAQKIAQLMAQLENERSTQVGDVRSKVPGLVASVSQSIRDQEFQKEVAAQSGLLGQQKLQLDTAYKQAKLGQGQQSLDLRASKQQSDALFKQAGLNIRGKQYQLAVQREHRLSQAKKGKKGGYTPEQTHRLRTQAIEAVTNYKHGAPATTKYGAVPAHPNDPRGAFKALVVQLDIPPSMADWAVGQLYGRWKAPGERSNRGPTGTGPR